MILNSEATNVAGSTCSRTPASELCKRGRNAEGQRDVSGLHVARGKSNNDRERQVLRECGESSAAASLLPPDAGEQPSIAPKMIPRTPSKLSRQQQVHQHAVDAIRLLVHVFQKENLARSVSISHGVPSEVTTTERQPPVSGPRASPATSGCTVDSSSICGKRKDPKLPRRARRGNECSSACPWRNRWPPSARETSPCRRARAPAAARCCRCIRQTPSGHRRSASKSSSGNR